MMRQRHAARPCRNASVLVLTLIVVALLTLGAAAFFERMFAEHRASGAAGRQLQARQIAESGVEYIKTIVAQDPTTVTQSGGLYSNPKLFQGVLVNDDPLAAFRGRFTVLSPDVTSDGYFGGHRYGMENESARLNLNTILLADTAKPGSARTLLMTLPGMTESIADAILDWIDPDDEPREQGAERDYYSSHEPPYAPRNGPLGSIEELLLVRGVTPALLYGPDLNRNGDVDASEQNLTAIDQVDNSMGLLNRGWAAYLTLDSAETNLRPDGTPKIDVNMDDLKKLQQQVSDVLGADMANFIVAYRQGGAYAGNESGQPPGSIKLDFTQPGRVKLSTVLDLIDVKTRIANSTAGNQNGQGQQGRSAARNQASGGFNTLQLGGAATSGPAGSPPNSGGRGGGAAVPGAPATGGAQGAAAGNSTTIVQAAFPKNNMQSYLSKLMDNLAVNAQPSIPGRLNVNQAPRQLLAGVPGLSTTAVDRIIAERDVTLGQQRPEQAHETWLLTDNIVDLPTMKKLMSMVTTGGSVYRAQVVGGFFVGQRPAEADRLEVVIDATKTPAIVRRRWDLRELGPGYSAETLGAEADDTR